MTEKRKAREIKRRVLLKGTLATIPAGELVALFWALNEAVHNPKVGFNHATTDITGWLSSIAPYGITVDTAFAEDLLYAANLLDELKKYKHPQGKTFDQTLKAVLRPGQTFDKMTNEILGGD